ncbi:unnamed protein product, partial [Rotaria magnacalcarata]
EVRLYQLGEKNDTHVAGGNGEGDGLNQLNEPHYLFVDRDRSVYVSDWSNHRVMKWVEGLFVDTLGTLYVADSYNHRVMRWTQGDNKQGTVIATGNGYGAGANQLKYPRGLSFDRDGNHYVVDNSNHRVQRFSIE